MRPQTYEEIYEKQLSPKIRKILEINDAKRLYMEMHYSTLESARVCLANAKEKERKAKNIARIAFEKQGNLFVLNV